MRVRTIVFAVLAGFIAAPIYAQVTTHKLDVRLVGSDCSTAPKDIQVVAGGKENESFEIHQDKEDRCHYTGTKPGAPFRIGQTKFSLRFGGARSDCRVTRQMADPQSPRLSVGELTFRYNPANAREKARRMTITVEPAEFYLAYGRDLPREKADPKSLDCSEGALFPGTGRIVVKDWIMSRERLRLQLLHDPEADSKIWMTLDEPLRKEIEANNRKRVPTVLSAKTIGTAYMRQVFEALSPEIRVNEALAVEETLKKQRFKSATLKVE